MNEQKLAVILSVMRVDIINLKIEIDELKDKISLLKRIEMGC